MAYSSFRAGTRPANGTAAAPRGVPARRIRRPHGAASPVTVAAIAVAALAAVIGLWLLLRGEPEPAPAPTPAIERPDLETVAPAETPEQRGDEARQIIAAARAAGDVDYDEIWEHGQRMLAAGRRADAQLLLFFAAHAGHAPSAFDLGTLYDPATAQAGGAPVFEPDAFQAYRWYRQAEAAGVAEATQRLEALKAWAQAAAGAGDREAERLLLQWSAAPVSVR